MNKKWRHPAILLLSVGVANVGDFIYLVAINLLIYQLTGSATAVALMWLIGPLTNLFAKFWTGSFIDYRNKRRIIIATYLIRAFSIVLLAFSESLILIFSVLIVISVAKAFFNPASMTYITMLIPKELRKRFNSIRAFATSGAFIIGPAIGGALITVTSVSTTLWINGLFFILSAGLLLFLPNDPVEKSTIPKLTLAQVKSDFSIVLRFMQKHRYVTFIYTGFIVVMIFTFAMDVQEVVFTQQIVGLTELEYTLLVSITGIGSVVGALLLSLFANKLSIRAMVVTGLISMSVGYVIYAFSWSFASIVVGFVIIGFFNVYLNAGITTFYQNNVQVEMMGRVTSIYDLVQSVLQIIAILAVGLLADLLSLRGTIVTLSLTMLVMALFYARMVLMNEKKRYYQDG
ncbi:MFS family permease [Alkalihalobacillus xiaoxiensis]|uniref:MFS family permease n=1 Tax=Shouchella xiaoxiensis TaxID=766895 RepID=A0ABS2SNB5_9BACI|nr:MFS transporter [Shouchella xiaoxiensis]MBM7837018.1 MFS family permease [Shouchella xiaoxiensis]